MKKSEKLLADDETPQSARSNSSRLSQSSQGSCRGNSFLQNAAARSSFRREKLQEQMMLAEDQRFAGYRSKLKCISLFFVILSVFILLNASIGASSAPFYDKYTDCNRYDLSEDCQ